MRDHGYLPPLHSKTAMVRWKRSLTSGLEQVQSDMAKLADESRQAPGHVAYLETMTRAQSSSTSLRWRDTAHQYLAVDSLNALLRQLPLYSQKWYRDLDNRARLLNLYERSIRMCLDTADEALSLQTELVNHAA